MLDILRGILLLIFIAILSGIIAYSGNRLGRYVGKKKLSVFKLRPRQTAIIFTIITGMLISLLTIGVSALLSKNVRTALFGLKKLQLERSLLQAQIRELSDTASQGKIVFTANQPIAINLIRGGLPKEETETKLENLIAIANKRAVEKNNLMASALKPSEVLEPDAQLAVCHPDELNKAVEKLINSDGSWGVVIYSSVNVFLGSEFSIGIDLIRNNIVFYQNDVITDIKIDTKKPKSEILSKLMDLIKQSQSAAQLKGMISDPDAKLPPTSAVALLNFTDEIKDMGGWVKVSVIAKRNLYTFDELDIKLELSPTFAPRGI